MITQNSTTKEWIESVLLLNSGKRLSIDIDIVVPEKETDLTVINVQMQY